MPRHRVVKPHPARRVGWYRQLSDADRRQSGLLAKALLRVCTSRAADIAGRAECDAQRFGGKRRIRLAAEPQNQRNPPNDMVPIGGLIKEPISGGCRFQFRQIRNCRGEIVDVAQRVVPG